MLEDSPSRYPRKSPRTNTFETDSKPAVASSHHQPPTTYPTTFKRQRIGPSVSASKVDDSNYQVHRPETQETVLVESEPVAQDGSGLNRRSAANNLRPDPDSVSDSEAPRKYRLDKLSFSRDSHLWRTPDEPSLNQILEQERNAWLAESPTDLRNLLSESDHESDAYILHTQPASSRPADHKVKAYQTCRSNQSSPAVSPLKRKSCFQEGSMNEGSRAIASTWDKFHPKYATEYDNEYQSDLSDAEGTPRALAGSRASTSSSIDINEFKPLPATPSTFKSTIKRLGQSVVKIKPAPTSEHITARPQTEKKERRGLKRSMSTWKIFSNSASDVGDTSYLTSDDEFGGKKTNYSSKTIKLRRSLVKNALSQKEVLDERKRKAEIAYSEQFGTARKKQKQAINDANRDDRLSDWEDPSDVASSRKKGLRNSSAIRNVKSVLRRPANASGTPSNQEKRAAESSTLPGSDPCPRSLHSNEPPSSPSTRNFESNAGRLEKQSREALEKENQRLRMMLRGKEDQNTVRRSVRHSRGSSTSDICEDGPSHATIVTKKSDKLDNKNVMASANVKQGNIQSSDSDSTESASKVQKSATVKKSRPDFVLTSDDVPPVPPLPSGLQQHKALKSISGNSRPALETATIKRRGPMRQLSDQNVLPRPLSMVLECVEGDDNAEQMSKKQRPQVDGVIDEENVGPEDSTGRIQSSHDSGQNTQRWDWGEDVF